MITIQGTCSFCNRRVESSAGCDCQNLRFTATTPEPLLGAGNLPVPKAHDRDFGMVAIVDAAMEVAAFARDHEWPKENSPEFFKFAQKLDTMRNAIRRAYPSFR